mmetsp:Transcript_11789/g.28846  ORF Transcript_11789/g.28846 Transcript_11789/m.28846 type:complete len:508 (-) Transcript_11789:147-1670(-)
MGGQAAQCSSIERLGVVRSVLAAPFWPTPSPSHNLSSSYFNTTNKNQDQILHFFLHVLLLLVLLPVPALLLRLLVHVLQLPVHLVAFVLPVGHKHPILVSLVVLVVLVLIEVIVRRPQDLAHLPIVLLSLLLGELRVRHVLDLVAVVGKHLHKPLGTRLGLLRRHVRLIQPAVVHVGQLLRLQQPRVPVGDGLEPPGHVVDGLDSLAHVAPLKLLLALRNPVVVRQPARFRAEVDAARLLLLGGVRDHQVRRPPLLVLHRLALHPLHRLGGLCLVLEPHEPEPQGPHALLVLQHPGVPGPVLSEELLQVLGFHLPGDAAHVELGLDDLLLGRLLRRAGPLAHVKVARRGDVLEDVALDERLPLQNVFDVLGNLLLLPERRRVALAARHDSASTVRSMLGGGPMCGGVRTPMARLRDQMLPTEARARVCALVAVNEARGSPRRPHMGVWQPPPEAAGTCGAHPPTAAACRCAGAGIGGEVTSAPRRPPERGACPPRGRTAHTWPHAPS